ncbi:MAG: EthD family reductase [Bacteroidetes bacterium]|nr:MAG: EthD family reductase [Bacteroidota bacterium]
MSTQKNLLLLVFVITSLISCKTSQMKNSSAPEVGMFKVTILYPGGDDKTFDMDYYEKKHMPMVAGFLGKNLRFYEIDKGISGRTPNDKPTYVAVGYFYITDVGEYNKAIAQNRDAVINDIKNYTNIQPVVQISEIKKVGYNNAR